MSAATDTSSTGHREQVSSPRWALAALSLSMLLASLGTSVANVGLPALAKAFGAPFQAVQWVVLAYLLAITTLIVSVGRLGDMIGRRKLLVAGLLLFTTASVLCGLAPSLWLLVAARAMQGLGAAVMMALAMALVSESVPKERIGSAMGLLGTTSAIGTALGPSLGGILISALGWQSIFLVNLPLGVLAVFLAARFLAPDREEPKAKQTQFDAWGALLLAGTLAAYALAMTTGQGDFGPLNMALGAAAILGLGLFIRVETKAASPLVRLGLLRRPALGAGFAMSALVTTVVMATLVVGPFYLTGALALDAAGVGLVMSCGPVVAALVGVPAGRFVDRFGAKRITRAGLAAMMAGSSLMVVAGRFGVLGYVGPLVAITAGYALFQAANNTAVMNDSPSEQRGVISGLLNLSRNLGLITGASAMGAIFALAVKPSTAAAAGPEEVLAGLQATFGVAVILVATAFLIEAASGQRARQRRP